MVNSVLRHLKEHSLSFETEMKDFILKFAGTDEDFWPDSIKVTAFIKI